MWIRNLINHQIISWSSKNILTFFFSRWWNVCMCFSRALLHKAMVFNISTKNQDLYNFIISTWVCCKRGDRYLNSWWLQRTNKALLYSQIDDFERIRSSMDVNKVKSLISFDSIISCNKMAQKSRLSLDCWTHSFQVFPFKSINSNSMHWMTLDY